MNLNCFVIGVNHDTADTATRSQFSVCEEVRNYIYAEAKEKMKIDSLLILNTCNRTEIAGIGDPQEVLRLYKSQKNITAEQEAAIFVKSGNEAIEHLFDVASGLNSKIIGDLEILGQFKQAFQESKSKELINGYFERLGNVCLQAAKEVKHNTALSSGTTSLSYAVVQCLRSIKARKMDRILIIGSGKIGSTTAKNIVEYLPNTNVYLTNRTDSKAQSLAKKLDCGYIPFNEWRLSLSSFDVIVTAIDSTSEYLIQKSDIIGDKHQTIIDLSVPFVADPQCSESPNIDLITIDELSEIINATLQKRSEEIGSVKQILKRHKEEFFQWSQFYAKSSSIRTWKSSLEAKIENCPFLSQLSPEDKAQYLNSNVAEFAKYIKKYNSVPDEEVRNSILRSAAIKN